MKERTDIKRCLICTTPQPTIPMAQVDIIIYYTYIQIDWVDDVCVTVVMCVSGWGWFRVGWVVSAAQICCR